MGIVYVELVVVCDTPHVVGIGWFYFQYTVGWQNVNIIRVVSESMKLVAVIERQSVPCTEPHEIVFTLFEV